MVKKTYEEASGFNRMSVTPLAVQPSKLDSLKRANESNEVDLNKINNKQESLPTQKEKKHRFKKESNQQPTTNNNNIHPSRQIDDSLIGNAASTYTNKNFKQNAANSDSHIPTRDRKLMCFNCRRTGHSLQNCPKKQTASRICYICGSNGHAISRCLVVRDPNNPFPFAECFVCKGKGHLSGGCPENERGVYPKGGSCVHCGKLLYNLTLIYSECQAFSKRL